MYRIFSSIDLWSSGLIVAILFLPFLTLLSTKTTPWSKDVQTTYPNYFRIRYIYVITYFLAMFAEWIKGPYIYALYSSYGFTPDQIASLYITGFLSSVSLGSLLSSMADKYGRKKACMLFSITYSLSALTKPFRSFRILLVGRCLSGISTALLYTAFESWLAAFHSANAIPQSVLAETFGIAAVANGVAAVSAGLVGDRLANRYGLVSPFLAAICPLMSVLLLVATMFPNDCIKTTHLDITSPLQPHTDIPPSFSSPPLKKKNQHSLASRIYSALISSPVVSGLMRLRTRPSLALLGLSQALFEGSVYVWVFLWTPALAGDPAYSLRHGVAFAAFMAAFVSGGQLFRILHTQLKWPSNRLCLLTLLLGATTLSASSLVLDAKPLTYGLFICFEVACGLFHPAFSALRAERLPDDLRTSLMVLFRVPMNLFVIIFLAVAVLFPNIAIHQMLFICGIFNVLGLGVLSLSNRMWSREQMFNPPSPRKSHSYII